MEDRDTFYMIWTFLHSRGMVKTAEVFEKEAPFDVTIRTKNFVQLDEVLHDYVDRKEQIKAQQKGTKELRENDEELLNSVEYPLPQVCSHTLEDLHSQNPIAVRFHSDLNPPLIATGGADKLITFTDAETGSIISSYEHHQAGILSLDFHPIHSDILLASSMDKQYSIIDVSKDGNDAILAIGKDHTKFVVRAKWSPDGKYFATASVDSTCCLYSFELGPPVNVKLIKTFYFRGPVESICFTNNSSHLVISARNDNYLNYVSLPSLEVQKYNMNSNGDDYVSFTVMEMVFFPNGKYLLVATDKSRYIVFRSHSNDQVLNIYGVFIDSLTQHRIRFHPSGKYFFATQENDILVIEIATQKITKLQGHQGIVRDIDYHPEKQILVSASYDRTFKIWSH